jgi:hypothetical protein
MSAPKNARQTNRGRSYIWPPTGEEFVSVTTVQRAMAKEGLVYWSARVVAEGALEKLPQWQAIRRDEGDEAAVRFLKGLPWSQRDKAADAGSAVHGAIDAEQKGQPVPTWPTKLSGFREQYERFKAAYRPEWITSEATVYSRKYGFAGTLDWIARIGGRVLLGDVKSGERVYDEVALQLAAYRYAEWMDLGDMVEHPLPSVEACAVLHLRPRMFQLVEVRADEQMFEAFLHLIQVYRWMQDVAVSSPVGEMVTPVNLVVPDPDPRLVAAPSLDELLEVPA